MKLSGVYKIESKSKINKLYIGSAVDVKHRWHQHICELKYNRHTNKILQNHVNKYGIKDLAFTLLTSCDKEDLLDIEQFFLDIYNPSFNICKKANNRLGTTQTEESKRRHSKLMKGKIPWNKGLKSVQVAWNKGMKLKSSWNKGISPSIETRKKQSISHIGNKSKRIICEFCNKDVAVNIYAVHHGEKCKFKNKK